MQLRLNVNKILLVVFLLFNFSSAAEENHSADLYKALGTKIEKAQGLDAGDFDITDFDLDADEFFARDMEKTDPNEFDYPNIYLQVYNYFAIEQASALKSQLSSQIDLSEPDLQAALKGQAISADKLKTSDTVNSNKALQQRIQLVSQNSASQASNELASFYKEAFYNESTFDSEVDLIDSMNRVYTLLFIERPDLTYNLESSKALAEKEAQDSTKRNIRLSRQSFGQAQPDPDSDDTDSQQQALNLETQACQEPNELDDQISNFETQQKNLNLGGEPGGGPDPEQDDEIPEPEQEAPADGELVPAEVDLCPDGSRFCFRIEEVTETWGLIQPPGSCILCLMKSIKQEFLNLNNQPLMPRKVTGNLLEMPACKSATVQVGLGFNLMIIGKPMIPSTSPLQTLQDLKAADMAKDAQVRAQVTAPAIRQNQNTTTLDKALTELKEIQALSNNVQKIFARSPELKNTEESYKVLYRDLIQRQNTFTSQFQAVFEEMDNALDQFNKIANKKKCYEL